MNKASYKIVCILQFFVKKLNMPISLCLNGHRNKPEKINTKMCCFLGSRISGEFLHYTLCMYVCIHSFIHSFQRSVSIYHPGSRNEIRFLLSLLLLNKELKGRVHVLYITSLYFFN